MRADPIFVGDGDLDAARALVESTDDASLTLYHGDAHLFADDSLPTYDAEATELLQGHVLDLLDAGARTTAESAPTGRRAL